MGMDGNGLGAAFVSPWRRVENAIGMVVTTVMINLAIQKVHRR